MTISPTTPTPVEPEIIQELRDSERDQPGYLAEFLGLMREGQVDGSYFYSTIANCGCFYGWRKTLHPIEWPGLCAVREKVTGDSENYTLLEDFLLPVNKGDTPATSSILAGLEQAILEIIREIS